jgi:tetratricopeptide (TPR) repeat protein
MRPETSLFLALLLGAAPRRAAPQCPDGSAPPCGRPRPALDTGRIAVLPFAHREGGAAPALDGADCAELLAEALERWRDVRLADKMRLYDALSRRSTRSPFRIPFDTALAIARQLGVGRVVMGQLWSFSDTLRLTAALYDAARGGAPVGQATARVAANGAVGAAFNALADSLLGADPGDAGGAGAEQTRSLRALHAYNRGEAAIRTWDLAAAAPQFRAAIAADSEFAHAHLRLGQTLLWAADSSPDAARDRAVIARRSGRFLAKLGWEDGALLLAQQALFERRWPDACARYREILAADSTSFAAWYGLAECNAGDPVVLRDPQDSTGYVFRGSWHTAARAYRRALLLAPSFNFFFGSQAAERLTRILLAEAYWWREGRLDTVPYFGLPALEGDTIAFHPISGAVMARTAPRPATHAAALARNRATLTEVTAAWVAAFPREPQARRALAYALELAGQLTRASSGRRNAADEIATAQRLERSAAARIRDAVVRVRLYVKAGEFAAARRAGDSLLRATPRPTTGMAGVAVLLGRPALAARLFVPDDSSFLPAAADNQPVSLPFATTRIGLALLAYAAVGAPADSIAALETRASDAVARLPRPPGARAEAASALLDTPASLAFDVLGPRPAHRPPPAYNREMAMQWALAQGDTAFVRANLDTLRAATGPAPPADRLSTDAAYERARLFLALGDTTAAVRYLDGTLETLPGLYSALLDYVPLAGTLVRIMALRAELAAARGEQEPARRWADAVVTLWGDAEPGLRPTLVRMTDIRRHTR